MQFVPKKQNNVVKMDVILGKVWSEVTSKSWKILCPQRRTRGPIDLSALLSYVVATYRYFSLATTRVSHFKEKEIRMMNRFLLSRRGSLIRLKVSTRIIYPRLINGIIFRVNTVTLQLEKSRFKVEILEPKSSFNFTESRNT